MVLRRRRREINGPQEATHDTRGEGGTRDVTSTEASGG